MKINKRRCRESVKPNWTMDKNNGLLYAEQIKYILRTVVKNIGGKRLLVIYVYSRQQAAAGNFCPQWVIFQSRTEYITLAYKEDGSHYWRTASFENLEGSYSCSNYCAFYTVEDEARVKAYCKNNKEKGLWCLDAMQREILFKRSEKRKQRKEKRIKQKMKSVPALPRGLRQWIAREIMPSYIFYDYHRSKKPMDGYCTACGKPVKISGVKHNQKGVCPSCKRPVQFKSRKKRGYITDRDTLQVFQRISDQELVVRFLKIYYSYGYGEILQKQVCETARIFVQWGAEMEMSEEHYYYLHYRNTWKSGDRPSGFCYQYNFEADLSGYLYYKNLDCVLADSPWKYSQMKLYYLSDPAPLYALSYLKKYLKYPVLEYLVKLRLYRLVTDIVYSQSIYSSTKLPINPDGKNVKEVLGVDRRYIPWLQKVNPGSRQMPLIKMMIQNMDTMDEELLKWCGTFDVGRPQNLSVPLRYMTSYKLMKYAEEQLEIARKEHRYVKMESLLTEYQDYLSMCEVLKFDLRNSFVLFPKNLKEAHDRVNDMSDPEISEACDRQIQEQYRLLNEQYRFAKYGYILVLPHTSRDIINEGQVLHHCVGQYVKKVAKKQSTILFIRKEKEPDKPLCTVEIADNEIGQVSMFGNGNPTKEIEHFLGEWKKEVLCAEKLPKAA